MSSLIYHALVMRGPGQIALEELVLDNSKPFAQILYCGTCGTDKHAYRGQLDIDFPFVPGHENVGIVNGRRVTWPTILPCMKCKHCKVGMENVCSENRLFGITTTNPMAGGWAEYTPLPEGTILFDVPKDIDDDVAVLIETMASTKALRQVDLRGKSILIIGSGPIGMLSAIHARHAGARLVGITGHEKQLRCIRAVVDEFYKKNIPTEHIESEYDIVMDAGGNEESLAYCIRAVKPRGVIIESGCMVSGFNCDVSSLVRKELVMRTQLGYVPDDFHWATQLVQANHDLLKNVITHRFQLSECDAAMEVMLTKKHGKIMFRGKP